MYIFSFQCFEAKNGNIIFLKINFVLSLQMTISYWNHYHNKSFGTIMSNSCGPTFKLFSRIYVIKHIVCLFVCLCTSALAIYMDRFSLNLEKSWKTLKESWKILKDLEKSQKILINLEKSQKISKIP